MKSEIPDEVKDLFMMHPTHWGIIDSLLIQNSLLYNTLYGMIGDTDGRIEACVRDLVKAGWVRITCPAGIALDDIPKHEVQLSKFAYNVLEGAIVMGMVCSK